MEKSWSGNPIDQQNNWQISRSVGKLVEGFECEENILKLMYSLLYWEPVKSLKSSEWVSSWAAQFWVYCSSSGCTVVVLGCAVVWVERIP